MLVVMSVGIFTNPLESNAAPAVSGDYDRDGRTDITVARAILGGWYWFIEQADGGPSDPVLFGLASGQNADTLYAGDFDGDGDFEPAVIRADATGFLTWYSRKSGGAASARPWGIRGDTPTTGYFDSDDAADITVVRNISGFLNWFVRSSEGTPQNAVLWGLNGDSVYTGDLNGDGTDELIVARNIGGFINWFAQTTTGAALTPIVWGLSTDQLLPPYDVNNDGVADLIVVRDVNGALTAFFRLGAEDGTALSAQTANFGLKGDVAFVGSFSNRNAGEFGVYREQTGGVNLHFVLSGGSTEAMTPFGLAGDSFILPSGSAAKSDSSGGAGLAAVCPRIISPGGGILWKPASDHSGQPRVGRPLIIFQRDEPSDGCLSAYASDGTEIGLLGVYERGGKYGDRFYSGFGCGTREYARDLAAEAIAATGSSVMYVEGDTGECVGPIPSATNRTGNL